jgi:DNA end-binding protein Ku
MAATIWNGRITFGLVSVPVKLFRAIESHDLHFNLLHESCRTRIRLQYYCPHHEKLVERSELVRGFEYEKGKYVLIEEEELERIEPDSSTNLDIERFIDLSEVDPIYFEKTYYVGPAEEGTEKTFALLATALRNKGRAGIGKLFMRDREYLALIRPAMGGLVLQLLHYEDEIRKNEYTVDEDKVRPKELQLAELLVENLTDSFDPAAYKNEFIERMEELIESKVEGRKLTIHRTKPKPVVTDLMKALEQSLRQSEKKRPAARAQGKSSTGSEFPIENYDELSVQEILDQLDELSGKDLQKVRAYEEKHKKRKSIMNRLKKIA